MVLVITACNAFLNGWFWMMGYELGIAPLINYLDVAPAIPYLYFVLLALAWALIKGNVYTLLQKFCCYNTQNNIYHKQQKPDAIAKIIIKH